MRSVIVLNVPLRREGGRPVRPGICKGSGMAAAALEHVPVFRGRMRWQEPIQAKAHTDKSPIPAKGGRSKMPVIKKDRVCAAWFKSLAK